MLLAKTKSIEIMLRARTPLRPKKMSTKKDEKFVRQVPLKDCLHARGGSIAGIGL
jgi:hypothetical protein